MRVVHLLYICRKNETVTGLLCGKEKLLISRDCAPQSGGEEAWNSEN